MLISLLFFLFKFVQANSYKFAVILVPLLAFFKSSMTSLATLVPSSMPPSRNPLQPVAQSALPKYTFPCFSLSTSRYLVTCPGLNHSQAPCANSSLCQLWNTTLFSSSSFKVGGSRSFHAASVSSMFSSGCRCTSGVSDEPNATRCELPAVVVPSPKAYCFLSVSLISSPRIDCKVFEDVP